jgi:hypothetical protein
MTKRQSKNTKPRTRAKKPVVLIIDDVPDEGDAARKLLSEEVQSSYREPSDVTDSDIGNASVILVDFKLDNWPARDDLQTPSLRPKHGIALAANLRSNLSLDTKRSPTAFALRSGKLHELSGKLSPHDREHSIAKMLDLDWVFAKEDTEKFSQEVVSLARAVQQLPHPWPPYPKSEAAIIKLLKIEKGKVWSDGAANDVRSANPPQDVLAETSNGMSVIRWLLHEVLPFPSFLLDERYIAARLRVHPKTLRAILASARSSRIKTELEEFRYTGLLHDFSGNRWWRAGVDHWLWKKTEGDPLNSKSIETLVRKILPKNTHIVAFDNPVLTLDDDFRPTDNFVELKSAVQIKPDDWPAIAEPAWVAVEDAKRNADLAARVVVIDRDRI